jgi:hypothetical protein
MIDSISVQCRCPLCGGLSVVFCNRVGYDAWCGGVFIQKALPELTADEREMLMTGYCRGCWNKMFPED